MSKLGLATGRALSRLRGKYFAESQALIIPPAVPGSLGDAAMISASADFLRARGAKGVDLLYGKAWSLDAAIDKSISGERFFYKQSNIQEALLVARLPHYSECYFIGADVIDGAYNPKSVCARISLLAEAAQLGNKATLLGSSYNKTPEHTTRDAMRNLPASVVVCARDPVSRERLESILNRPIRQVADLAFLLKPRNNDSTSIKAVEWISQRRNAGQKVIGLNANYLHLEKDPSLLASLKVLLGHLLKHDLAIMLIPHDTRSAMPDEKILQLAAADFQQKHKESLYMLPPESPGIVRAVAQHLDLVATGRMHTAILSLSGGTPAFCFAYQDKFEGLFQFFKLENSDLLSSPAELSKAPIVVGDKRVEKLGFRDAIAKQIEEYLPGVKRLSAKNFD